MRLGIDFGTTNSSVAYYDGMNLHPIELDPHNENSKVLPSLIYVDRQYDVQLGTPAATAYLENETGRRIKWERRDVGAIEIIVAGTGSSPIRYMQDIHIVTDTAANGRLLQSIKTALRDPGYEGTEIFDRYYTLDDLITLILRQMKEQAEAQLGQTCDDVVLGRPVKFSDKPEVNQRAEEILYKAALFAGFKDIVFQLEPIAAAHLYHKASNHRELAFIFDFGGGTLDLTLAEIGSNAPPRVIATRGVLVGGDDLDRRIMRSLLKYFGEGATVNYDEPFPPDFLDTLHTWQTMPELSRPYPLSKIRQFQKTSNNRRAMRALETLVTQNVGFKLFREIERTKKELSHNLFTRLDFEYDQIKIRERILQRKFEEMIEKEVLKVEQEIRKVLDEAGVAPEQVGVILRTGGTSLVPAFIRLLEDIFGHDKIREMDPLTSVVGGMAVSAHEGWGIQPTYAGKYRNPLGNIQATSGREYRPFVWKANIECYTDRDYAFARLPLHLNGLYAVQTADLDYESQASEMLRFTLSQPAKVYVLYLAKANTLPKWLREFELEEDMQVEIDSAGGRMPFLVYSKMYPEGVVTLGGPQADGYNGIVFMNYLVGVQAV